MVLVQLLLPVPTSPPADDGALIQVTRHELAERFHGLTAYVRSPAKGSWTAPDGRTEEDDVMMVEVVAPTFDRSWRRTYAATLATRFKQERIHLRAMPVELLEEGIDE